MNLLTTDRGGSRTDTSAANSIRLVSIPLPEAHSTRASKWFILFGIVAAFVGGFGLSSYWRPPNLPIEQKIQIADFRVEVPEGETAVVITSREGSDRELARLQIERRGDEIFGIPEETHRIAPRQTLNADDIAFFRRELNRLVLPSDSPWDKANKIRIWLTH